jgi:hypothetical protein
MQYKIDHLSRSGMNPGCLSAEIVRNREQESAFGICVHAVLPDNKAPPEGGTPNKCASRLPLLLNVFTRRRGSIFREGW